jgi:uncharacterized membrane protein
MERQIEPCSVVLIVHMYKQNCIKYSLLINFKSLQLGASLLLIDPNQADAARSGGRSGGSSFRSSPSRRLVYMNMYNMLI